MRIKYINHNGEILNLAGNHYVIDFKGIFDYEWNYKNTNYSGRGGRVTKFYRDTVEKDVTIYIKAVSRNEMDRRARHFYEIIEADVLENIPGRLVLDTEEYMICYLIASKKVLGWNVATLITSARIVSEKPFWCRDIEWKYNDKEDNSNNINWPWLNYSYNYPYNYLGSTNMQMIINDYIAGTQGNQFKMIIYGYVNDPVITIGHNQYKVHLTVYDNEYLVIDSRDKTVKLFRPNGEILSKYDFRDKVQSVFAPIEPGRWVVASNAVFDLTIYQERSEPIWNL